MVGYNIGFFIGVVDVCLFVCEHCFFPRPNRRFVYLYAFVICWITTFIENRNKSHIL